MKKILVFVAALLITMSVQSQTDSLFTPVSHMKNSVSLEFGGVGLIYSVNYERLFHSKFESTSFLPINSMGLKAGITQLTNFSEDNINVTRLNLMLNFNFGKKKWFAEMGIGFAPTIEETTFVDVVGSFNAKYQSMGGFCLKFGGIIGKLIDKNYFTSKEVFYFPSISLGYSF